MRICIATTLLSFVSDKVEIALIVKCLVTSSYRQQAHDPTNTTFDSILYYYYFLLPFYLGFGWEVRWSLLIYITSIELLLYIVIYILN